MLTIVDNVDIDTRAAVPCPMIDFRLRRAAVCCPSCEHYQGIGLMCTDETQPWHKRFAIRCVHPVERRTHIVEVMEQ